LLFVKTAGPLNVIVAAPDESALLKNTTCAFAHWVPLVVYITGLLLRLGMGVVEETTSAAVPVEAVVVSCPPTVKPVDVHWYCPTNTD
jgi:hypothetical protein